MSGIQLIPIDATSKTPLTDRATLTVSDGSPIVFLGDNDSTGIVDPYLDSNVVKLYKKGNKFYAFCLSHEAGRVTLNGFNMLKGGRRELKLGDILTLWSSDPDVGDDDVDYCYRVGPLSGNTTGTAGVAAGAAPTTHLQAAEPEVATPVTAAAAVASAAAASLPKEVGEEAICAICMEIMLEPRTVSPCGHSFCRLCLTGQSECAECRGPITSHVVCRSLQNLIGQLVTLQSNGTTVFENEDFENYKKRSKGIAADPPGASATDSDSQSGKRRSSRGRLSARRATRRRRAPTNGDVIVCLDD